MAVDERERAITLRVAVTAEIKVGRRSMISRLVPPSQRSAHKGVRVTTRSWPKIPLATLFLAVAIPAANAQSSHAALSAGQQAAGHSGDYAEPHPTLTQENKWGWDFTTSKWTFGGVYDTNNGPRVILAEKPCCNSARTLLWDPLTGTTQSLDEQARSQFIASHPSTSWPVGATGRRGIPVDDRYVVKVNHDFGGEPCIPATYNNYYTEYDLEGHPIRSFYIIRRLRLPRRVVWQGCGDGETWNVSFSQSTVDIGDATMAPLKDGSVLVWVDIDSLDNGYLLRLDRNLQSRSTVKSNVFVIDHDDMERRFWAAAAWQDPKRRAEIMDTYIDRLATSKHE
jgi:hypothetical protein